MRHIIFRYKPQEKRRRTTYFLDTLTATRFRRMTLSRSSPLCPRITYLRIPQKTWYSCILLLYMLVTILLHCMTLSRCGIPPCRIMLHKACYCKSSGRIRRVGRCRSSSARRPRHMSICPRCRRTSSLARRIASRCILRGM